MKRHDILELIPHGSGGTHASASSCTAAIAGSLVAHGGHPGSASWITDAHGYAVQHLQYLPFGEPFVDQRISGYSERSRFTGKERDVEKEGSCGPFASERGDEPRSGMPNGSAYSCTYFGARYMDHELMTMWLSVDPMADKYPNISPYAYCALSPVRLVDPNGEEAIDNDDWYKSTIKNSNGEYSVCWKPGNAQTNGNYNGDLMMNFHSPSEIIPRRKREVNLFNNARY